MKRSVSRKILLMLSVLGIMVILACVLNASALKFVAGYNVSVETEVENAMAALEKEGITKVALVVFEKNQNGNGFWEKIGFTVRNDLIYRNKTIAQMERIDT